MYNSNRVIKLSKKSLQQSHCKRVNNYHNNNNFFKQFKRFSSTNNKTTTWATIDCSNFSTLAAVNYCTTGIKDYLLGEVPRLVLVHYGVNHLPYANFIAAQVASELKAEVVIGCMSPHGVIGNGKFIDDLSSVSITTVGLPSSAKLTPFYYISEKKMEIELENLKNQLNNPHFLFYSNIQSGFDTIVGHFRETFPKSKIIGVYPKQVFSMENQIIAAVISNENSYKYGISGVAIENVNVGSITSHAVKSLSKLHEITKISDNVIRDVDNTSLEFILAELYTKIMKEYLSRGNVDVIVGLLKSSDLDPNDPNSYYLQLLSAIDIKSKSIRINRKDVSEEGKCIRFFARDTNTALDELQSTIDERFRIIDKLGSEKEERYEEYLPRAGALNIMSIQRGAALHQHNNVENNVMFSSLGGIPIGGVISDKETINCNTGVYSVEGTNNFYWFY